MSKELSATIISVDGSALEMPKLRRQLEDSERLMHHSFLKEWQSLLMRAAALWNIKTKNLFLARESDSFEAYTDSIGLGDRARRRYVQIGQMMFLASREKLGDAVDPLEFTFTSKSITDVFEGFFTNGHVITVEGLGKSAKSLETFRAYLEGNNSLADSEAQKLLMSSNVVSEKALEKKERTDLTEAEQMKAFHDARKIEAEAHGLKWDKKNFKFTNLDGSPLRDEQIAEMTMPEDAFRPWKSFYKEVAGLKKRILGEVSKGAQAYRLYDEHIQNTLFHTNVTEIAKDIRSQIELVEEMLECMLAKDFERMEELTRERE